MNAENIEKNDQQNPRSSASYLKLLLRKNPGLDSGV
jgi:hypothetical protein